MNDINLLSAEEYTAQYAAEIEKILTICPDSDIIVAGITPILPLQTSPATQAFSSITLPWHRRYSS
ncbi:MAG: hypothetical protein ACLTXT_04500 [Ruminococcus callidus]